MTSTTAAPSRLVTPAGRGTYLVSDGSDTDGIDPHQVEIRGDIARCDCRGFQYRHRCRHLDAVGAYLLAAPLATSGEAGYVMREVGPGFEADVPLPDEPPDDVTADPDVALGPFAEADATSSTAATVPLRETAASAIAPAADPFPWDESRTGPDAPAPSPDRIAQLMEKWNAKKAQLAAGSAERAA